MRTLSLVAALLLTGASALAEIDAEKLLGEAQSGDAQAQCLVGIMYRTGRGVPQDLAEAAKWYKKAAEQGDVNAQRYLGYVYLEGEGVPQDSVEAAKWYRKAAEQGDANAQCIMGLMYAEGQGVAQDFRSAYLWLSVAIEHSPTISDEQREAAKESFAVVAAKLELGQIAETKAEAERLSAEIEGRRSSRR